MNRNLIIGVLSFFLAVSNTGFGQVSASGVIRYEERIDVHKMLPPNMAQMKQMIPQYTSTIFRLYFDPSSSIYFSANEDQPVVNFSAPAGGGFGGGRPGGAGGPPPGGGRGFRPPGAGSPQDRFYTSDTMINATMESFGENYLVVDTLKMAPWKLGAQQRTILGYQCNEAYYTSITEADTLEITAWYTTKVRPFVGPYKFNTLPGAVLALDINGGEHYWVARKVELRELTAEEKIEAPAAKKKSEQMTLAAFEQKKIDQEKQMRARFSGGGR